MNSPAHSVTPLPIHIHLHAAPHSLLCATSRHSTHVNKPFHVVLCRSATDAHGLRSDREVILLYSLLTCALKDIPASSERAIDFHPQSPSITNLLLLLLLFYSTGCCLLKHPFIRVSQLFLVKFGDFLEIFGFVNVVGETVGVGL